MIPKPAQRFPSPVKPGNLKQKPSSIRRAFCGGQTFAKLIVRRWGHLAPVDHDISMKFRWERESEQLLQSVAESSLHCPSCFPSNKWHCFYCCWYVKRGGKKQTKKTEGLFSSHRTQIWSQPFTHNMHLTKEKISVTGEITDQPLPSVTEAQYSWWKEKKNTTKKKKKIKKAKPQRIANEVFHNTITRIIFICFELFFFKWVEHMVQGLGIGSNKPFSQQWLMSLPNALAVYSNS